MKKDYANYILQKNKENYNLIAEDYAKSRNFVWDIQRISDHIKQNDKILDIGCGNGRMVEILEGKNVEYTGLDISEELIKIAKTKYPEMKFIVGNALNPPFLDCTFDKVFCIRMFHHIPSFDLRVKFLKEVNRVLKPNGLLIITVWNLWKLKNFRNIKAVLKNIFLKIVGKSNLDFKDAWISWGDCVNRYYHFFTKRELLKLCKITGFKIQSINFTLTDIYLVAKKCSRSLMDKAQASGA